MMLLAIPSCSPMRSTCFVARSSPLVRFLRMNSEVSITPSGLRSSCPMEPTSWPKVESRSTRDCCASRSSRYVCSMIASSMSSALASAPRAGANAPGRSP